MAIFHGVYAAKKKKKQIALFPLWSIRAIRLVGRTFRSNLLNGSIATLQVPIFSSFCQNARYVVMRFHDIQQIQNSSYFFPADFKEGFKWWIKAYTFIVKRYLTSSQNKNRTDIQFYILSLQKAFFSVSHLAQQFRLITIVGSCEIAFYFQLCDARVNIFQNHIPRLLNQPLLISMGFRWAQ